MFTANVTDKLKLMRPLDSDQFESQDFYDTFSILDSRPGIAFVDSYAGLATLASTNAYGPNQNGLVALDRHNNALWRYNNTSGTGSWVRINSVGYLKGASQANDVASKATTGIGSQILTTGVVIAPGQRTLQINCLVQADNNSSAQGFSVISLVDGSTTIRSWPVRVGAPAGSQGNSQNLSWYVTNPTPESSHEFKLYIRSVAGSASNGGGGTSVSRYAYINVIEQ